MLRSIGRVLLWALASVGTVALVIGAVVFSQTVDSGCSPELKAGAELAQLSSALEFYRLDNGRFPTTEQGLVALVSKPLFGPPPANYPPGGYLKRPDLLRDPWGQPYRYVSDGESFLVVSTADSGCLCQHGYAA